MRIAGLAESTRTAYIGKIEHLTKHYKASPADLGANHARVADRDVEAAAERIGRKIATAMETGRADGE